MVRSSRFHLRSTSPEATRRFGYGLGRHLPPGTCVGLVGTLGAGKTLLVQSLCDGLGVADEVLSPTFILTETLPGRSGPVTHVDLYRMKHEEELEEIGLFEQMNRDTVVLVEWADRSPEVLRLSDMVISIAPDGEQTRQIDTECEPALATAVTEAMRW